MKQEHCVSLSLQISAQDRKASTEHTTSEGPKSEATSAATNERGYDHCAWNNKYTGPYM